MTDQTQPDTKPPINKETARAYGKLGGQANTPAQIEARKKTLLSVLAKRERYRADTYAQVQADIARGLSIEQAAINAGITPRTVYNWTRRYASN